VCALSPYRAYAQVQNDPVSVPLQIFAAAGLMGYNPSTGVKVFSVAGFNVGGYGNTVTSYNYPYPTSQSFSAIAKLVPGKNYTLATNAQNVWASFKLYLAPPSGYRLFINDIEQSGIDASGSGSGFVPITSTRTIRIESRESASAGVASSLRPGRLIWTVGLGNLKNQSPAGVIALRQNSLSNLSASDFSLGSLIYNSSSSEIQYLYSSTSSSYQIFANQCIVQIDALPSGQEGFTLSFFDRLSINVDNLNVVNGMYDLASSSPYMVYKVENSTPFSYAVGSAFRVTRWNSINTNGQSGVTEMHTEMRLNSIQPSGGSEWVVTDWNTNAFSGNNPLVAADTYSIWTYTNGGLSENIRVFNSGGGIVSNVFNVYKVYDWGTERRTSTSGYGSANPLVTQYEYFSDKTRVGNYSRLQHVVYPTGKWVKYAYYDDAARLGMLQTTYEPDGDSPATPSAAGKITTFDYAPDYSGLRNTRISSAVKTVNGLVVNKKTVTYETEPIVESVVAVDGSTHNVTRYLIKSTTRDYASSDSFLTTVSRVYREDAGMGVLPNGQFEYCRGFLPGLPYNMTSPDGSMQVWTYTRCSLDPWIWGTVASPSGTFWNIQKVVQRPTGPVDGGSTFSQLTVAPSGIVVFNAEGLYTGGAWHTVNMTRSAYGFCSLVPFSISDSSGDSRHTNNWTVKSNTFRAGFLVRSVDGGGVAREFQYNASGWITAEIIKAVSVQGSNLPVNDFWTVFSYDGLGRIVSVRKQTSSVPTSEDSVTSVGYDLAGRSISSSASGPNGLLGSSCSYFYQGNSNANYITYPNQSYRISTRFLDGRPKSESGTAVYSSGLGSNSMTYGYEAVSGNSWDRISTQSGGYRLTVKDWLGRTIRETTPGSSGARIATLYQYDSSTGRLEKKQAVQASSNDSASFSSVAITSPIRYTYDSVGRLRQVCTDVNENGIIDLAGPDRISEFEYSSYVGTGAGLNGSVNTIWSQKDSFTYRNGSSSRQMVSSERSQLNAYATAPDSVVRISKLGNAYYTGSNDTAAAAVTTIVMSPSSAMLRTETIQAGATNASVAVDVNGLRISEVGSDGVSTFYNYDSYGRKILVQGREQLQESYVYYPGTDHVKNVRNCYMTPSVIGSEWKSFSYDSAGRLTKSEVNQTGSTGYIFYEYNSVNKLVHRWGSMTSPAELEYDSNDRLKYLRQYRDISSVSLPNAATWPYGSITSDLTSWAYDESTGLLASKTSPVSHVVGLTSTVSYTYDSANRPYQRTWGRGVQTKYEYYSLEDCASGMRGELKQISYPNSDSVAQCVKTKPVILKYNRNADVTSVEDSSGVHSYTYDDFDLQMESHSSGDGLLVTYTHDKQIVKGRPTGYMLGLSTSVSAFQTVAYGFESDKGRLNSVQISNPYTGGATFTYTYHPGSNLVQSVDSGPGLYSRTTGWESWRDLPDWVQTSWGAKKIALISYDYDWTERMQGETLQQSDQLSQVNPAIVTGLRRNYAYTRRNEIAYVDAFKTLPGGGTQYDPDDTASELTDRYQEIGYDDAGNRKSERREGGWLASYGVNAGNQYTDVNKLGYVFLYDDDGNLTSDGKWLYFWDAENRLDKMSNATMTIEFAYDYANRRVAKTVNGVRTGFVYDGWNIIGEYSGSTAVQMNCVYAWGLDLSGSLSGAGGVGGLLLVSKQTGGDLYPVYGGKGHVRGYIDSLGVLKGVFEYNLAGELINTPSEGLPNIRYASKYYDQETQLYQYGHRYYSPALGRFIARDPIGEIGGINLYQYCNNNGVNTYDLLGCLPPTKDIKPVRPESVDQPIEGPIYEGGWLEPFRVSGSKNEDAEGDSGPVPLYFWMDGMRFDNIFGRGMEPGASPIVMAPFVVTGSKKSTDIGSPADYARPDVNAFTEFWKDRWNDLRDERFGAIGVPIAMTRTFFEGAGVAAQLVDEVIGVTVSSMGGSSADVQIAQFWLPVVVPVGFGKASKILAVDRAAVRNGSFSVIDWKGYPSNVPKPIGTMRLLQGAEYTAARRAADTTNNKLRKGFGLKRIKVDVHEIQPVKFNGSPTDPTNKMLLPRDLHRQQVTPFWDELLDDLEPFLHKD